MTTVTENYGSTFCAEFLATKVTDGLVERSRGNNSFYWGNGLPINLMDKIVQKVNNHLSSGINNNEFIVGFIIHVDTVIVTCHCNDHKLNIIYIITNYGNIYSVEYDKIIKNIDLNKYIVLPGKTGSKIFTGQNTNCFELYLTLEKIVITNQKLYNSEIDEIKKNTLIVTSKCSSMSSHTGYSLNVNYLFKTPNNNFSCSGSDQPTYICFLEKNLDNWKLLVSNHKKMEALQNIVLENEIELQNQRDTIEALTPGAGAINPNEQMSLINENNKLKKIINEIKSNTPPEHFNCPISTDVMKEPVIAMDGHTYDRNSIELWFENNNTSPMTREIIDTNLIPNYNLKSQIDEWYNSN